MSLFAPPELIETEVFAEVPARLRKKGTPPERLAAGKSETPAGCFLEGPAFDRAGNLYVVDLAYGRIFRISSKGVFETFAEYDGEPNGIAIHKDGRVFVADHKLGIVSFDPKNPKLTPVMSRYHQQGFKGVNDLFFDLQPPRGADVPRAELRQRYGHQRRLRGEQRLHHRFGQRLDPEGAGSDRRTRLVFAFMKLVGVPLAGVR